LQQLAYRTIANGYILPPRFALAGLGDNTAATRDISVLGGAATPVIGVATAPAVASALGMSVSLAGGLVTLAFAGVLLGIEAIMNSGCGQTCVVTSQWANQAAPLLEQNITTYFQNPNRTIADQQSALNMFDAVWAGLVQRCSQSGLGTAGQNCISDRQAGACKWHQTGNPEFPGQPTTGQCWNWFNSYRDPIAQDVPPGVVSSGVSPILTTLESGLSGNTGTVLLIAGVALVVFGSMN